MADTLITLAEYKALQGVQNADDRKDTQITALLSAASRAVRTFTGRNFEVAAAPATRSFQYDGSEMLDIDDCTAITHITAEVPGPAAQTWDLTPDEWTAMPQDDSDVFYYIIVHGGPYFGGSPEMGFKRNLDQYPSLALRRPNLLVTATWGWPAIPEDVKYATALTLSDWMSGGGPFGSKPENLTSEAIAGYARSWGNKQGGAVVSAVPNRAQDLLASYQRIFV